MAAWIFLIVFYLLWAIPSSAPAFLLARFLPGSRPWLRYLAAIAAFTLLVTPTLGSATIAVVAVPFAFVLLSGVVSFDPSVLAWTLREWPLWHAVSFPCTMLVAMVIFHRLFPKKPPTPMLRRDAA